MEGLPKQGFEDDGLLGRQASLQLVERAWAAGADQAMHTAGAEGPAASAFDVFDGEGLRAR